ncbi:hypothetical protein ACIQF5_03590 [Streptomyces goshikiensis]|uniref:hypothetical protein n=1 Tax=Streptomyces goshikiensis TaxID=1942 RepID=UPI003823E207
MDDLFVAAPDRTKSGVLPLVVIIVICLFGSAITGHAADALAVVVTAPLTVVTQELVRAAVQHRLRVAWPQSCRRW